MNKEIRKKIFNAISKFELNLSDRHVLTEAATGNYVVTPVLAALAGAKVTAFTKNSRYGSLSEVRQQTIDLAAIFGVEEEIKIVDDLENVDLGSIDILTNTGFLRPINKELINKLSPRCVIPLMWEPWEFREGEIDLKSCSQRGIKVYGTNERDERLRTMEYLGDIVRTFLQENDIYPENSRIVILGCDKFVNPVADVLNKNHYDFHVRANYSRPYEYDEYDALVVLEHSDPIEIIGGKKAFIDLSQIVNDPLIIHICGNIDVENFNVRCIPENPASFGYMSFTTDYLDNQAVIDLHTAGLKVAEGMLEGGEHKLSGLAFKEFMEANYPALAFGDPRLW